jgi:hypothetical protein
MLERRPRFDPTGKVVGAERDDRRSGAVLSGPGSRVVGFRPADRRRQVCSRRREGCVKPDNPAVVVDVKRVRHRDLAEEVGRRVRLACDGYLIRLCPALSPCSRASRANGGHGTCRLRRRGCGGVGHARRGRLHSGSTVAVLGRRTIDAVPHAGRDRPLTSCKRLAEGRSRSPVDEPEVAAGRARAVEPGKVMARSEARPRCSRPRGLAAFDNLPDRSSVTRGAGRLLSRCVPLTAPRQVDSCRSGELNAA